jgi:hypothetical protein
MEPADSAGRSIPVSWPNPKSSSIFCIFCTGAFGDVTTLALVSSDRYMS